MYEVLCDWEARGGVFHGLLLGTIIGLFLSVTLLLLWHWIVFVRTRRNYLDTLNLLGKREIWMEEDKNRVLRHIIQHKKSVPKDASQTTMETARQEVIREMLLWYGLDQDHDHAGLNQKGPDPPPGDKKGSGKSNSP